MDKRKRVKAIKFAKGFAPIFLLLIILSSSVFATAKCELDKYEYSPGEIGTLFCECTLPNEESKSGYIVWTHENGTVLQSTSINSGSCRTSFFGNGFLFPSTYSNYNGSVNFTLNSDGSGEVLNWYDIADTPKDNFSVQISHESHCIISNIKLPPVINLGIKNTNIFTVIDELSGNPIVGVGCVALAFGVDDVPLFANPYNENYDFFRTVQGGTGYLTNTFSEKIIEPHTTYEFSLYCQCTNNSENNGVCYDDTTGERLGYKSCSISGLITTGDDLREGNTNSILVPFLLITFIFVLCMCSVLLHDATMSIIAGIVTVFLGLYFLINKVGNLSDELNKGLGVLFCLVGIYMTMIYILRKFQEKKQKNKIKIDIEED